MLISIVIPVYNRAELMKATLDSVKAQTHRPIHLVLVDNNSTDNTLQVLENFKLKNETQDFKIDVIEEKRQGASIARNSGAKLVNSEWLMFFDSDDTMDDCLVEKYVEKIRQNEVDLVCTAASYEYMGKTIKSYLAYDNLLVNHIFHGCLSTVRYIVKRSLFEQVSGWNEELSYWDDWELGIRLLLQNPSVTVLDSGIYVHVNVHNNSITGNLYSERNKEVVKTLLAVQNIISESNHKRCKRLLRFLQYRKVLLAGLYKQEGRSDLAHEMWREVSEELKNNTLLKCFYWLMYKYVSWGGRGSQRVVKHLVK